jgi:hypothetical protein
MKSIRRLKTKVLVAVSILLVTGTIIVCIAGERRFRENKYKKYSGAREVNAILVEKAYEN